MKRTKKFLVGFLAALSVLCGTLGLAACDQQESSSSSNSSSVEQSSSSDSGSGLQGGNVGDTDNDTEQGGDNDDTDNEEVLVPSQGLEYTLLENDTYEVTSIGDCKDTEIVIPATYNGKAVTSIREMGFSLCDDMKSIFIPDGVASIGVGAFYACSSLTRINVSKNNTTYKDIEGNLYTKDGTTLLQYAVGKTNTSFIIPESVTCIGSCAFSFCSGLTSIVVPSGVTSIAGGAFLAWRSLTSIVIPNSVTSIGASAFYDCGSLTSVYISSVEAWCNISFGDYYANPLSFKTNLYLNNELITELEIPDTIREIKSYAFYYCNNLTSIEIPDSVTSIGNSAFYGCLSLTSIEIPDSVTSIGERAFEDCTSLKYNEKGNLKYLGNEENPYMYLAGNSDTSITSATIESTCKFIGSMAFYCCYGLTSVVLGDSVTSIGGDAFHGCSSLTSVEIPDSVTRIYAGAFYGCESLTSVVIGKGVVSIGESAFADCESLNSITFNGKKAQWIGISKHRVWISDVPATKVVCSDGEVSL